MKNWKSGQQKGVAKSHPTEPGRWETQKTPQERGFTFHGTARCGPHRLGEPARSNRLSGSQHAVTTGETLRRVDYSVGVSHGSEDQYDECPPGAPDGGPYPGGCFQWLHRMWPGQVGREHQGSFDWECECVNCCHYRRMYAELGLGEDEPPPSYEEMLASSGAPGIAPDASMMLSSADARAQSGLHAWEAGTTSSMGPELLRNIVPARSEMLCSADAQAERVVHGKDALIQRGGCTPEHCARQA